MVARFNKGAASLSGAALVQACKELLVGMMVRVKRGGRVKGPGWQALATKGGRRALGRKRARGCWLECW
jgi:hypothetical protein